MNSTNLHAPLNSSVARWRSPVVYWALPSGRVQPRWRSAPGRASQPRPAQSAVSPALNGSLRFPAGGVLMPRAVRSVRPEHQASHPELKHLRRALWAMPEQKRRRVTIFYWYHDSLNRNYTTTTLTRLTWYRSLVPWAWSMWFDLWDSLFVRSSHCWEMEPSSALTSDRSLASWAASPVWERIPPADWVSWSNCGLRVSNSRSMNWKTEEECSCEFKKNMWKPEVTIINS